MDHAIPLQKKKQQQQQCQRFNTDYGAMLGEQYLMPIEFRDGSSSNGSVATTVSTSLSSLGSETESLTASIRRNRVPQTCSDYIFTIFGFESNPMRADTTHTAATNTNETKEDPWNETIRKTKQKRRNSPAADLQLSMLSNFSTAYNVICISLALQMMKHVVEQNHTYVNTNVDNDPGSGSNDPMNVPIFKYHNMTSADTSLCSSALIAGMILGQLTLGTIGDVLGRHIAMSIVMILQIIAAFCSSFAFPIPYYQISTFHVLALWRFLLGVGCGGVYPLAATLTTESSNNNNSSPNDRAKCVALTFSFQGVGYMIVPVIAYIIVAVLGESSDYGWRILLGLGSLPGIVLTIGRQASSTLQRRQQQKQQQLNLQQSTINVAATIASLPTSVYVDVEKPCKKNLSQQQQEHLQQNPLKQPQHRTVPISILDAILYERQLIRKLLGTAGCWLLFDILFYGNVLFQPVVLNAAFGTKHETIAKMCTHSFLLAIVALPGYYVSVYAVGRQSPRYIQIQGFFVMGILYLTIGTLFDLLSQHSIALLIVYGLSFFFSNYGPNATTFMLPSMTFSKACRSTLNGICAACGKAGALIGATIFVIASHRYGEQVVFFTCALLSFVGCLLTLLCVSGRVGHRSNDTDEDEEEEHQRHIERTMNELNGITGITRPPVTMRMVYSHPSIFDSFPQE